jgi:hypothetical protein
MGKPLDTRIINKAVLGDIRLSLNIKTSTTTGEPGEEVVTPMWLQQATIDYDLRDADGNPLGQRVLTHQTASVDVKPTLAQAISAVGGELRAWILADRLLLADDAT